MPIKLSARRSLSGMTLVEVMMSTSIGCTLMALVGGFFFLSFRSVTALTNYAILENSSRNALDQMTSNVRQAHAVITNSPSAIEIQMLNPDGTSGTVRFEYDIDTSSLNMIDQNGDMKQLLNDCTSLNFSFFQRPAPGDDWNNLRDLGTNSPSLCKVVQVQWTCSRQLLGSLANTEIMQSTKIVLRTSNWKSDEYSF